MTVRCKFRVSSITYTMGSQYNAETKTYDSGPVGTIRLNVVGSGSAEDKAFFASTPSGQIDVSIIRKEAADQFTIGREFYVDFTPA